jgi:hypothetical protein
MTIFKQEPAPGQSYSVNTALANSEHKEYVIEYFETDSAAGPWSVSSDGYKMTVTVPSGHTLAYPDKVKTDNFTNLPYSQGFCQVDSSTATTVTFDVRACNGGFPASGSTGVETTGVIEKVTAPNQTGNYEVYTTTGSETFYLMNKVKDTFAGDASCTLAKAIAHDSSCFTAHPVINNVLAGAGVYVEVGPTQGNCTWTGSVGTGDLALHSTIEFDVKFTSNQDATKTHISHYLVCKNGAGSGVDAVIDSDPGYIQLFAGQSAPLVCTLFGSASLGCHWTISSTDHLAASGTDPVIGHADSPSATITAGTKGGGYMLQACADEDGTLCTTSRMWIAKTQTPPAANADGVIISPCEVDPAMSEYGGEVIHVGPTGHSFAYNGVKTIPLNTGQWHWGLTIVVHNEFSTPGSPFTIPEYWGLNAPANIGPSDGSVPIWNICGIPNPTSGEMPVFEGTNATGASWLSGYTQAGATLFGATTADTRMFYTPAKLASNHSRWADFRIQNVTLGVPYTRPDGTQTIWGNSSAERMYGYSNTVVQSVHAVNVAMPFFGDCNPQQSGWKNCQTHAYYWGNHCEKYGIVGQSTEHCFYEQSLGVFAFATWEEGSIHGNGGATGCYSFRGVTRVMWGYNRCVPKDDNDSGSGPGGDSENQDAYEYTDMRSAFGPQGLDPAAMCSLGDTSAPFCPTPDAIPGGVNTYAAFVDAHYHTFFNFSNATFMNSGAALTSIAPTHDINNLTSAVNLYFYHNTNRSTGNYAVDLFEDRRNFRQDSPASTYFVIWPSAEYQNDDVWNADARSCAYNCGPDIKYWSSGEINYKTNVVRTGQFTITSNILAKIGWDQGVDQQGIQQNWDYADFPGTSPVELHKGGWIPANFIFSDTDPVDSTTLAPGSTSPDVGAASPLVWPMNYFPPRFTPVTGDTTDYNNGVKLRTDGGTTIGAYEPTP